MNQRDRDLLEKQLAWVRPAPGYGSLKLAITLATMLVGLGIGSTVILHDPNTDEISSSTNALPDILAAYDTSRAKL